MDDGSYQQSLSSYNKRKPDMNYELTKLGGFQLADTVHPTWNISSGCTCTPTLRQRDGLTDQWLPPSAHSDCQKRTNALSGLKQRSRRDCHQQTDRAVYLASTSRCTFTSSLRLPWIWEGLQAASLHFCLFTDLSHYVVWNERDEVTHGQQVSTLSCFNLKL